VEASDGVAARSKPGNGEGDFQWLTGNVEDTNVGDGPRISSRHNPRSAGCYDSVWRRGEVETRVLGSVA
jgi:hypothetical protein